MNCKDSIKRAELETDNTTAAMVNILSFESTIRRNLLNLCNLVSISKELTYYVFVMNWKDSIKRAELETDNTAAAMAKILYLKHYKEKFTKLV